MRAREPNLAMALVWGLVFVNLFMRAVSVATWCLSRLMGWA